VSVNESERENQPAISIEFEIMRVFPICGYILRRNLWSWANMAAYKYGGIQIWRLTNMAAYFIAFI